jgi:nicotinic acid mononucleotide adenylyltransferase
MMTAFEHLYQHASYLTIKNHKKREEARILAQKDSECTFKPKTTITQNNNSSSSTRNRREGEEWLTETMKRSVKQYEERRRRNR